jgi:hypothetical protein
MQKKAGKGFKLGRCLPRPCEHGVRIEVKHPSDGAQTEPFGHGGHHPHDPLGSVCFAIEEGPVGLQKVGLTHETVQRSPGATPWMAIGAEIPASGPAIIRTRFRGTVMRMEIQLARSPPLGCD